MYDVGVLVWLVVLVYAVAMVVLPALAIVRGGAPGAGLALGTLLGAAMIISGYAAGHYAYRQDDEGSPPWIAIPMVGLLVILLTGSTLRPVRRAVADPATPVRLLAPQAFRLGGFIFLTAMVAGDLPPNFGLPAGIGDLIVGVGALWLWRKAARGDVDTTGLRWFNLFGLFDLVVAVVMGTSSLPGILHTIHVSPTTQALALLPLALIPSVGVPIMATMHIVSLRQLGWRRRVRPLAAQPDPASSYRM